MVHRYAAFIKVVNLFIDYLLLNVSMFIAYIITGKSAIMREAGGKYLPVILVVNLIWLLSTNISGLYNRVLNKDSIRTYQGFFKTYLLFILLISFVIAIIGTKAYLVTQAYLLYAIALFGFLAGAWKLIFLAVRKSKRNLLMDSRNIVIVGAGRIGRDVFDYFEHYKHDGYKILGFFDDKKIAPGANDHLYLGKINDCISFVLENKVDEIFCALPVSQSDKIEELMNDADKYLIRFKIIPEYYINSRRSMSVQNFDHIPIISVRPEPLENMLNRMVKRLFDIVFSLFVIIFILSWLFPILAILIKIQSRGPILFVQQRSGKDNQPFNCYKFRSMRVNGDADNKQANKNDDRITPIGGFIRRTSLDEFPQFFNTLIGNMSIVGPRPHMINHTKQYALIIDKFMVRHFLKPGITGWAQISGFRGETKTTDEMLQRVEADVWYLENWSFLLDLKIIFLTFWNILKGDEKAF